MATVPLRHSGILGVGARGIIPVVRSMRTAVTFVAIGAMGVDLDVRHTASFARTSPGDGGIGNGETGRRACVWANWYEV